MATLPILDAFASNWWAFLIRGILALLFGVMAFAMPGLTLSTLVLIYALYVLADGLMAIWVGGTARTWWFVLLGILAIFVGIYTLINPGITAVALLYFIAGWAIVRGISEIITAMQLRKELSDEWMMVIVGIISILLGVALFFNPVAGALAMVWLIGSYAVIAGITLIVLAFRLRAVPRQLERLSRT
jgi:uncharacterized membrane protein HdeD (DUF308 family)